MSVKSPKYWSDVYIASPFFSPEQLETVKIMEDFCEDSGARALSPRQFLVLKPGASFKERQEVFDDNISKIKSCNLVLACIDGLDAGTLWEMGFAFAINKPVIALSLKQKNMNVMLACGVKGFLENKEDLKHFLKGHKTGYAGVETGRPWDFNWEVARKWFNKIY